MFRYQQGTDEQIQAEGLLACPFQFTDTVYISHDLAYGFNLLIDGPSNISAKEINCETYYLIKKDGRQWELNYKRNNDAELEIIDLKNNLLLKEFNRILDTLQDKNVSDMTGLERNALKESLTVFRFESDLPKTKAKENIGNHVTTACAKTGSFLFSKNFKPCQAVIAKLNDGSFALYHAFMAADGTEGFNAFVEAVKDKIEYVYVIQKESNSNNLEKAPVLALNLSRHLGENVKRINVENYEAIVVDSINNKVVICMNVNLFCSRNNSAPTRDTSMCVPIAENNAIDIYQSAKDVIVAHEYDVVIKSNMVIAGKQEIPIEYVSPEILDECKNKLNTKLYKAAKDNKLKKANKLIKNGADLELAIQSSVIDNNEFAYKMLMAIRKEIKSSELSFSDNINITFSQGRQQTIAVSDNASTKKIQHNKQ